MLALYLFPVFLVLYELATYLANDMIMPGMVQVVQEFHAPSSYIALSLSLYILGNCALIPLMGSLAERYGKRLMILLGSLSFLVFTALIAVSHHLHSFMSFRFLEGCGLAVITVGYGLIHAKFNDKSAVKLIALMGNITILAPLIGPVLGALIVSHASWRFVFYATFLLALVAFIGLYRYTPKDDQATHAVNIQAIFQQYRLVIQDWEFWRGTLTIILATTPILLWISQAPTLILITLQESYRHFALYQLLSIAGIAIASFAMQFIAGRYTMANIIKTGGYLLIAGLVVSVLGHHSIWVIVLGQFFYTLGLGLANGCLFRLVLANKTHSTNLTSTVLGFSQSFSFAASIALVNQILHYFHYSLLSYTVTTLVIGIVAFGMIQLCGRFYQQRQWQ